MPGCDFNSTAGLHILGSLVIMMSFTENIIIITIIPANVRQA